MLNASPTRSAGSPHEPRHRTHAPGAHQGPGGAQRRPASPPKRHGRSRTGKAPPRRATARTRLRCHGRGRAMSDCLAVANAIEDAGIARDKAQRVASVIFAAVHVATLLFAAMHY